MDQRSEPRIDLSQPVTVVILGHGGFEPVSAVLTNLSGRGMRLYVDRPIGLDTPVRVDLKADDDAALVLGEVVYCVPQGDGYVIGLDLQHSLFHLTDLQKMMDAINIEAPALVKSANTLS
jgi:hypothetical protein